MKIEILKKLIKEAVKEAVREELLQILSEDATPKKQVAEVRNVPKYAPKQVAQPKKVYDNPLAELMDMTRNSMVYESQGPSSTSHMVSAPGLGMQSVNMEDHFARPEPGIDLSQLDFVGRAAAVFKASQEKDKQKFGH